MSPTVGTVAETVFLLHSDQRYKGERRHRGCRHPYSVPEKARLRPHSLPASLFLQVGGRDHHLCMVDAHPHVSGLPCSLANSTSSRITTAAARWNGSIHLSPYPKQTHNTLLIRSITKKPLAIKTFSTFYCLNKRSLFCTLIFSF